MKIFVEVVTVTTAGTPVVMPVPTGDTSNDKRYCQIDVFALGANTGTNAYLGITSTFSKTTGVGLILPGVPKTATDNLVARVGSVLAANELVPAQFYVDVDTSADKVVVVYYKKG